MKRKIKMKKFIANSEEFGGESVEIEAKDLNDAVEIANSMIDVHEVNEEGEIID